MEMLRNLKFLIGRLQIVHVGLDIYQLLIISVIIIGIGAKALYVMKIL